MTRTSLPTRTYLHHHQFQQFKRRHPVRLQADSGSLWVTVDGEPDDIEITAGSSRDFDGHAVVTVGTMGGDALFTATPLAPPAGWLSLLDGLQGLRALQA